MIDIAAELFTFEEVAEATGRHVRMVYRAAAAGELGEVHGTRPARVTAGAIHAWLGRSVNLKHKPARDLALDYKLTPADLAFIWRTYAEIRDSAWVNACERARVKVTAPRLPPECRLDPTYYARFTQSQVYEFLDAVAAQRDHDWRCWAEDPLYRASHPAGPDAFTIADIATPEKLER